MSRELELLRALCMAKRNFYLELSERTPDLASNADSKALALIKSQTYTEIINDIEALNSL